MKLDVHLSFESWAEFADFAVAMQQLGQPLSNPQVSNPPVPEPPKSEKAKPVRKPGRKVSKPKDVVFQPSHAMLEKLQRYVNQRRPFRTADIVEASILKNPARRAQANQWLQSQADLTFAYSKTPGMPGRGPLVYTPVRYESGKAMPSSLDKKRQAPVGKSPSSKVLKNLR